MEIYEIQNILENIDPLVVLGGLSLLGGMLAGYLNARTFDRKKGNIRVDVYNPDGTHVLTPTGRNKKRNDYDPILALRKQKPGFYLGVLSAIIVTMFGTAALYEGITENYL